MSFLLHLCDGTESLVNSMAFGFAPISAGTDPLAAFTFRIRFGTTAVCLHIYPICAAFAHCIYGILALLHIGITMLLDGYQHTELT